MNIFAQPLFISDADGVGIEAGCVGGESGVDGDDESEDIIQKENERLV